MTNNLGKPTIYDAHYNPDNLFAISRLEKRQEIGINDTKLPFFGFDLWNHYEVSWLNQKGKPLVALAEINYSCDTPFIIESKSMKLYFNSFNNTVFKDENVVVATIECDLEKRVGGPVKVKLLLLNHVKDSLLAAGFSGKCLDELDIDCAINKVDTRFLKTSDVMVKETLHSNLLKSNCLVTHQPDWASIQITYAGKAIDKDGLLRYLISFRNHNEFHEQCIERIFMDIMHQCQPEMLTIYGRYTRRGGIDINPYRSTLPYWPQQINHRLCRQ